MTGHLTWRNDTITILWCVLTQKDSLVLPNAHVIYYAVFFFNLKTFSVFKNGHCFLKHFLVDIMSTWYKYQHELPSLDPSWQNQLKLDPLPLLLIRLIIEVHSAIRESEVWTHNQGGKGRWYYWQYSMLCCKSFLKWKPLKFSRRWCCYFWLKCLMSSKGQQKSWD